MPSTAQSRCISRPPTRTHWHCSNPRARPARADVHLYRALCLLALGRGTEADARDRAIDRTGSDGDRRPAGRVAARRGASGRHAAAHAARHRAPPRGRRPAGVSAGRSTGRDGALRSSRAPARRPHVGQPGGTGGSPDAGLRLSGPDSGAGCSTTGGDIACGVATGGAGGWCRVTTSGGIGYGGGIRRWLATGGGGRVRRGGTRGGTSRGGTSRAQSGRVAASADHADLAPLATA